MKFLTKSSLVSAAVACALLPAAAPAAASSAPEAADFTAEQRAFIERARPIVEGVYASSSAEAAYNALNAADQADFARATTDPAFISFEVVESEELCPLDPCTDPTAGAPTPGLTAAVGTGEGVEYGTIDTDEPSAGSLTLSSNATSFRGCRSKTHYARAKSLVFRTELFELRIDQTWCWSTPFVNSLSTSNGVTANFPWRADGATTDQTLNTLFKYDRTAAQRFSSQIGPVHLATRSAVARFIMGNTGAYKTTGTHT